jgi:hypothetical protein
MEHAVNSLDMRQESISKTFSLRSSLDQTSNIGDLEISRVHRRRLPEITQKVLNSLILAPPSPILHRTPTYISRIRNSTSRLIRLNSTKRIILRRSALLRQEIEQARLSDIRKTDASHLQILANSSKGDDIIDNGLDFLGRHF